jgi:hypothetical protein
MSKLWLVPLLACTMWGADLSGTWSGIVEVRDPSDGEKIKTPVKAQFEQRTGALSGSIGRKEDEAPEPIRNGKVNGKTVVFEVRSVEARAAFKFSLVLVSEAQIEGDLKGALDIGPITGKIKLTRDASK